MKALPSKMTLAKAAALGAGALLVAGAAVAQPYPVKPVHLVVGIEGFKIEAGQPESYNRAPGAAANLASGVRPTFGTSTGHGLTNMRERAQAMGASFHFERGELGAVFRLQLGLEFVALFASGLLEADAEVAFGFAGMRGFLEAGRAEQFQRLVAEQPGGEGFVPGVVVLGLGGDGGQRGQTHQKGKSRKLHGNLLYQRLLCGEARFGQNPGDAV